MLSYARVPAFAFTTVVALVELLSGQGAQETLLRCPGLEVVARQHETTRARETATLELEVRNTGGEPTDVVVSLSPELVSGFDSVAVEPQPPSGSWDVVLEDLGPGQAAQVSLLLEAVEPGARKGEVFVSASADAGVIVVPMRIFVAP